MEKYTSNSLPPTCIFTSLDTANNTMDAYNRMKNALYSKLTKCIISDPEYKAIVKHGSIGKDGFEVLYKLMTVCHPKLVVATNKTRDTNPRPVLTPSESIYSYCKKLSTWLTIEHIKGIQYTNDQVLDIFMEQLRTDDKYEVAVTAITSELTIKDTMLRNVGMTNFPEHLKIYHLPSTVMSYYTKEERNSLFPTDENSDDVIHTMGATDTARITPTDASDDMTEMFQVIIKAMNDSTDEKRIATRERIDEMCEGCGMYGHNVYKTGCDRCAQYLMIKKYLENNPQSVRGILSKYKRHQKNLSIQRKSKETRVSGRQQSPKRYNTSYSKARVKKLQDAIFHAMNSDSEDNDEESFASAAESNEDSSHGE